MKKLLYTIGLLSVCSSALLAQQKLNGVIKDTFGKPIVGVQVSKVGERSNLSITDEHGLFTLELKKGDYIDLNYADVISKRVIVVDEKSLTIVLDQSKDGTIDMGLQKRTKMNQTQSTSVIYADDLYKKSASMTEVTDGLYGLLSGLYVKQNTGWQESATLKIRGGGGPVVVIDGFRRASISDLALEEIESVQVLKDGAATALWGADAANGVLLITTKRGIYSSFDVDVNYRHGFNLPINQPKMADAYTYAMAQNEALYYDGLAPQYNQSQLNQFQDGSNLDLYPNTNWVKEGMRDLGHQNQFNIAVRGGGKKIRYYSLLDYKNEFGLLSDTYSNYSDIYSSQIRNYQLQLRMNLDVDITSTTKVKVGLSGLLKEHKRPDNDINTLFSNLYTVPAAAFPIKTSHNFWGSNTLFKMNPIAEIADVGYLQDNIRTLNADMRLSQDLSMFTPGLSAELAIGYDNSAVFRDIRSKTYMYEVNYLSSTGNPMSDKYGNNTIVKLSSSGLEDQSMRATFEGLVNYDRVFGDHQFFASAIFRQEQQEGLNRGTTYNRMSYKAYVGYNYQDRYMVDVVGDYFGSSVLLKGDRFRFYPTVSAGWNLSNEGFMKGINGVDLLKLRTSWGMSSVIGSTYGLGNYFWVGGTGYPFGDSMTNPGGLKEQSLPVLLLENETSKKVNLGIDARLWKGLTFSVDGFYDHRSNILTANNKVSGMLGVDPSKSNIGENERYGVEFSLGWKKQVNDFSYYANANCYWMASNVIEDGQAYQPYDYLYTKGNRIGQLFGLEAIGYFNDDADIANCPTQTFSVVRPGDIKYKDQNNDGKIDFEDRVAIGKSTSLPDMVYGINLGAEYKGLGVDLLFNGVQGFTTQLNVASVHHPLRNGNRNISTWYLSDRVRWTEDTKETANVPRLSTLSNENNYQASNQWIEDGSFFKLRTVNLYYNLPQSWTRKVKIDKFQIYARANNVFSIDKIDYFNCEDLTLGYPDLFSLHVGVNINF